MTVNGRTFTRRYSAAERTHTRITPARRTCSILLDAQGRVVSEQVAHHVGL